MDIKDFLLNYDESQLKMLGILNTRRNLLNSKSVYPLIDLMIRSDIEKLTGPNWFLDIYGNFSNPKNYSLRYGNIKDLMKKGDIFLHQNKMINPYYQSTTYNSIINRVVLSKSYDSENDCRFDIDETIFVNEDLSKPENRINLALFGLFLHDNFREWFLDKLEMPTDSIIFPTVNLDGGIRPDFAISDSDNFPLAYIEVELGTEDSGQLINFREKLNKPVYSICGKKNYNCHLSLEEIYDFLNKEKKASQLKKNFTYFEKLYYENVVSNRNRNYRSTTISETIRNTPIVKALFSNLSIHEDIGRSMYPGEILIETKKMYGFSLRIYSKKSKVRNSFSIMARSGGRDFIIFPSLKKMQKYLPAAKHNYVNDYARLILSLGFDIYNIDVRQLGKLSIKKVEANIDSFIEIIKLLSE
jgi:hypothetical protein